MTVGIDDGNFYLIDNWPGEVDNGPNPASWVANGLTANFSVGTKRAIYDDTNKGWSRLMYLKYEKGSAAAVDAKGLCSQDITESAAKGGYHIVTNDGGECTLTGPIAIALATMADGEYGWFWVGGVCPVDLVAALDGVYITDGDVAAGTYMVLANPGTLATFSLGAATDICTFSAFSCIIDGNVS
jgi:hypothetical protein